MARRPTAPATSPRWSPETAVTGSAASRGHNFGLGATVRAGHTSPTMTGTPPERRIAMAQLADLEVDHHADNVDEFDSFVRGRTPALLRAAYLLTGDQHLAEDLVQSALARTHRRWAHLHHEGNAEAYTRKTMYHLQVSWWRRPKVAESMPGDLPELRAGHDHAEVTSTRVALRRALLRLTPKQRAVLVLRFFEDHSEAETAELLDIA